MKNLKNFYPLFLLVWVILVAFSLIWSLSLIKNSYLLNARSQSLAFFDQVQIMRLWNAKQGGVYAKINKKVQSNPYLEVPNKDLYIDSLDMHLTLLNPAYMTRLVADIAKEENKTQYKLTSLNPLNPKNKADEWETQALLAFENGLTDTLELMKKQGVYKYSYMKPLMVKKACMKCHAKQGYQVGDIRGAMRVITDATPYIIEEKRITDNVWLVHVVIFIVGLLAFYLHLNSETKNRKKLETANAEISKQKEIAIELQKKAELGSHYKSIFLANMSHEIRTPLNGIIGFTQVLKRSPLSDIQKEQLNIIELSSENLLTLVNDIVDYSKIEANQLLMENISVNLSEVLNEIVAILHMKAKQKGLKLLLDIHPDTPIWVKTDPTRIKQILINYINNALKFTQKGFVSINVYPLKTDQDKTLVRFDVQDTGIGIKEENLSKLFKVFSQAESSTTRKFGGSGLGLAISKKLAHLLHGEAGVESEFGKGSVFWFTADFEQSHEEKKSKEHKIKDLSHLVLQILLVEDNMINQKVAQAIFGNEGFEIDIANNGKEGAEQYKLKDYDFVFMDIQMPVMDGYDATKEIRKHELLSQKKRTIIIAMTANALKGEKEKCKSIGMNDYLSKPFKPEDLLEVISRNL
ncbi:MAG: hypothetical protein B7C24_07945 [Bacteroidetes bacterium 4572_77]|nr:MAG: hypothetical protein B7C24_07945 [Bacteroidetes bacterium 4572_77]